jgi:hypothetical protein
MKFMNGFKTLNMKKVIVILIALTAFPLFRVTAQNPNHEKLNAYKIAFFTRRMNLTSQEAEKFWPVYNEFQDKRNVIQIQRQALNRNFNQNELNMTEKELIEAGDKSVDLQVQEATLAQEYHKRFKEILSPAKVIRLYQAENQYRLQLLNELKDNKPLRNNLQQREQGKQPL